MFYAPEKCKLKLNNLILNMTIDIGKYCRIFEAESRANPHQPNRPVLFSRQPEFYTCQLFLRYRREIFILGVLGFLKMTQSFPNIPEDIRRRQRSLPKAKLSRKRLSTRTDVSCHLFILHMVFLPHMDLS